MDLRDSALSPAGGFELWGFPGAGKSTQAKLLRGRRELSLVKLRPFPWSFLTRPSVAVDAMSDPNVMQGVRQGLLRYRNPYGRISRLAVQQLVALRGRPLHLIEEGLVHEIWRHLYSAEGQAFANWQPFMKYVGPNIILLDVEPQEALRRIHTKRSLGPINRQLAGVGIEKEQWGRAIAAYHQLHEEIKRTPGVTLSVIKVDDLQPAEVSEEIVRIVRSCPPLGSGLQHPLGG